MDRGEFIMHNHKVVVLEPSGYKHLNLDDWEKRMTEFTNLLDDGWMIISSCSDGNGCISYVLARFYNK